jgi:large subunit ribosomal protein L18
MSTKSRNEARLKRHQRVRKNIFGSSATPRLCVYRSLSDIYAQIIDDEKGVTLVASSSIDKELREKIAKLKKVEQAAEVGKLLGERAKSKNISSVVFDRGGYQYIGRVKALADGARESGLKF